MRRGNPRARRGTAVSRERVSASSRWPCGVAHETRAAAGVAPTPLRCIGCAPRSGSRIRHAFATGIASGPHRIPHAHANATE
ncbi:hypothetical protein WT27_24565 [Burkholderia territorii]|uniref:Uncharacterized protein n=1 Tax=Burkholderia territorii TaxID=1503055 RepID=A0A105W002_9BURK|nr:hypothetical protein WT27_24565 [Burkholderia territorii]KVX35667.1 hypothetical protein WT31_06115 [Burkholderia territorii]